ncbi:hypothetical protein [Brachybacterium endophyticum]|nr:hypothetical protein [Brachybacterium endophyticum]
MWRLVFGAIILVVACLTVFFIGYVAGTTTSPLAAAAGLLPLHAEALGHA